MKQSSLGKHIRHEKLDLLKQYPTAGVTISVLKPLKEGF